MSILNTLNTIILSGVLENHLQDSEAEVSYYIMEGIYIKLSMCIDYICKHALSALAQIWGRTVNVAQCSFFVRTNEPGFLNYRLQL